MKEHFDIGIVIVPYEMLFWNYIHIISDREIFGGGPRNTGLELKYLSDLVKNIITMIKLVENKKMVVSKEYVKSHGKSVANTARLC